MRHYRTGERPTELAKEESIMPVTTSQPLPVLPRPDWLRVRFPTGPNYLELKDIIRSRTLHTVCEEAHCPNIGECWENRTATFMILGRVCTRACRFCAITTGVPVGVDEDEPERVAEAVEQMGLRHAVVTSVARDDRPDGGASVFADTIRAIRRRIPSCTVEVLVPDFEGSRESLQIVMDARPDILNHNLETVRRLQRRVRAKAFYERSLEVLRRAKTMQPSELTKSGIMLGLGETREEISETLRDLRAADCDIVTIGQYLRPSEFHLPIARYVTPAEFAELKAEGMALGFRHVESGPLVRSSYHAHEQVKKRAE
jgi:lipoic acid synthetase